MLDPTEWTVSYSKKELKVNETVEIIFTVTIDRGWHFYSLGSEPPQAIFNFDGSGFQLVGKMKEGPKIQEKFDENLGMQVKYFDKHAEFRQTIKITKKNPSISIEVDGQACPNGPGQCVRVTKSFKVKDLKVTGPSPVTKPAVQQKKQTKPVASTTNNKPETTSITDNQKLEQLEAEKAKLISKDAEGKDESIEYLRNFVNKYGVKK